MIEEFKENYGVIIRGKIFNNDRSFIEVLIENAQINTLTFKDCTFNNDFSEVINPL